MPEATEALFEAAHAHYQTEYKSKIEPMRATYTDRH
jgi:hypothetical protein